MINLELDTKSFFPEAEKQQRFIPFYLSDDFVKGYARKKVPWGPLGEFTFLRTYSREINNGRTIRKERWHETIRRVVEGCFNIQKKHCFFNKVPWNNTKAQDSAKIMYDLMFYMKFLPPGRGLWMMGSDYVEKRGAAALLSCAFASTDGISTDWITPFKFAMDMSMLGVGIGFDTNGEGKITIKHPIFSNALATIPDTREGWVETMCIVLNGFFDGGVIPKFDYSKIRPEGAPISGFGGVASGPDPLIELVDCLIDLYYPKIGSKITSADIVDTFNLIGRCVVSGNVRRSALLALGNCFDTTFMDLKNYDLFPKENSSGTGWRQASNNSISALPGMDYSESAKRSQSNGEPGYIWMDNVRSYGRMVDPINNDDYKAKGVNACTEQALEHLECCNLVETFPSRHSNYDEYRLTLKYAYLYAKSVTLLPTHWEQTNSVMLRNRRIGTSQSGIIDAFCIHGRANMIKWSDMGYKYLKDLDRIYSDWLCIPKSIKITSVKPSGTVSLLPGVSPGIHYPHSQFYIRRVRVASTSDLVKIMSMAGYKVEVDEKYPTTQMVIEFPVKTENFIKGKSEVTMWEQLLNASDYQKWWADNQVSVTVTFSPEEARDIPTALSIFDSQLKAVSFLPLGKGSYAQMPYEEITEEEYNAMMSKLSKPDYSKFIELSIGEKYCDGEYCLT